MLRSVMVGAAAASLVLSPIAAQAATRASDAAVSLAPLTSSDQRLASPVAEAEDGVGKLPLWLILLLLSAGIALEEIITSRGIID